MNGTDQLESKVSSTQGRSAIRHRCNLTGEVNYIAYFIEMEKAEKVLKSWRYAEEMREALEDLLNKVQDHTHTLTPRDIINAANHAETILNKVNTLKIKE